MNPVSLLEKYFPDPYSFKIILEHSSLVADKAFQVARNLTREEIDMNFLEEVAMLHDIGVCRTASPVFRCFGNKPYILHGVLGKEILEEEGLPRHALVCERHIGVGLTAADISSQKLPLPERDMMPVSIEEKIICFADLFYSKSPKNGVKEKSIAEVKQGLKKFGEIKVMIFEGWIKDLNCS